MSFERLSDSKQIGGDFTAFVDSQVKLYSRQLGIRNSEEELKFNEAVLGGNISLNEQLDWRKEQLKRIGIDPNERRRVRGEIAHLKDRVEQRTFADAYLERLTGLESGISSIDSVITWLEKQEAGTNDLTIKTQIAESLREQKENRFTMQKQIIENETKFAINDKSDSALKTQLEKVEVERNKARFASDLLLESVYNLQVQTLEKAITENTVERSITTFAVNTLTNGMSSISLLDSYNGEVEKAVTSGNIQIGGSLFGSAKEFWRFRRGQYVTDQSAEGFFTRYTGERNRELGLINAKQDITLDDIREVTGKYDTLLAREELQGFDVQIQSAKQSSVQVGTDIAANQIFSNFSRDFDVDTAVSSLNQLKILGGDVSTTFDKIIQIGAANKQTQVNNILQSVQNILANNPGLSAEEALNTALKSGAGSILSPEQLAGKTEEEIVTEQIKGAEGQEFPTEDPRLTAGEIEAPPVVPEPKEPEVEEPPEAPAQPRFVFETQLQRGARGGDVLELQKFLNQAGFAVAQSGAGAPGSETEFFGPLTEAALQKFQKAQEIVAKGTAQSTGFGRLGPQTLEAVNKFQFE